MRKKSIFVYILLLLAVVCTACFGAYQYFFGALEHDSSFEDAVDNAVDTQQNQAVFHCPRHLGLYSG